MDPPLRARHANHVATDEPPPHPALRRELGVFGATMLGLGSIVGTGVFVSIGIAAGVAGPAVVLAIALAAVVATLNALSSAQLAACHPVSGGTYEYGYRYLRPWLGFVAGWTFLCAKSASAATAALGLAGYLLNVLGIGSLDRRLHRAVALAFVLIVTRVVLGGMRRSSAVNIAFVSVTLAALAIFVGAAAPVAWEQGRRNLSDFTGTGAATAFWPALLEATALMFVAYTGYGRIATLGEEVVAPRRTIPRAIGLTLCASALLYVAVAVAAVGAVGAAPLALASLGSAAPLEVAARSLPLPHVHAVVAAGAMTAMLGVLLNLVLGLSRVMLAMARRGDMPRAAATLNPSAGTPTLAVVVVGVIVAVLVLVGNVKTTWSFSAFTVLLYYAITNLAALFIPDEQRLYGRWVAWSGLGACLLLAWWVDWKVWSAGLLVVLAGLLWHAVARGRRATRADGASPRSGSKS